MGLHAGSVRQPQAPADPHAALDLRLVGWNSSGWRLCRRAAAELCLCLCALVPVGLFLWFMPLLAGMLSTLQPASAVPDKPAALEARGGSLEAAHNEAQRRAVEAQEAAAMHAGMREESIVVVRYGRWLTEKPR